ncbi:MAG: NAD-dependent epimerase/dehydratase family protein [Actinomycetota bacterium]
MIDENFSHCGAGYIGRVATSILLKRGFDVTVLDDCSTGHRESVSESVRFIEGSILNHDDIAQGLIDCQAVLHFAGLSIVADSMKYPDRYWQVNVDGAKNLLDGMRRVKVEKLVFSSSAAVYGEVKSIPIAESAATHPTNPYGATKLAIEKLIEAEIKIQS